MKYYICLLFILIISLFTLFNEEQTLENSNLKYIIKFDEIEVPTYNFANITAYSPNCLGCIGVTASSYDVKNTIYYEDKDYGKVNILAADKNMEFGTIISFIINEKIINAIVLDRGSQIGYDKYSQFDLLFKTEEEAIAFGIHKDIEFEILRKGF